jgi:hypothetical protein
MSSARQGLSIVGQAVGAYFGGPVGAAIGGAIGGEIGGFIDGPPEGPRLDDLSAPQIQYGGKVGRLYGGPKWFEIGVLWASEKRESSETVGGKGGDSGQEQFSYRSDFLFRVCESREGTPCEVIAVTGVEVDGQLVWTALADATYESLLASQEQEDWSEMTVQLGSETQAPWAVMETAVGVSNANAYRGYLTVGFTDFLLGNGGAPRRVRIQCITAGTQGGANCVLQANFVSDASDDSAYANSPTASGSPSYSGVVSFPNDTATHTVSWESTALARRDNTGLTLHARFTASNTNFADMDKAVVARYEWTVLPNAAASVEIYFIHTFFGLKLRFATTSGILVTVDIADDVNYHAAIEIEAGASPTLRCFLDGAWVYSGASGTTATLSKPDTTGKVLIIKESALAAPGPYSFAVNWVDLWQVPLFADGSFTAYSEPPPPDGLTWAPTTVLLQDILEYEAERCTPLAAANIDFSAAAGLEVECHVAIGSAAEAMQPLLTRFWFDLFSADKLYLVRRGGSVEQTIPFRWTGAGAGGRTDPFAGLIRNNDVEVAKKKAITYSNVLMDGEADTRTGDREAVGSDVDTLRMNLHMRPTEAQGLADTATYDTRVGAHTATVRIGARHGLLIQPGSVVNLIDHKGNTYRVLVRRIVWDRWAWECEVRLDDPQVLVSAGIAVDVDQRSLTVVEPPAATLYVLDIPLLRLQDDSPGEYVCVTQTGRFRGVDILKSTDGVSYAKAAEVTTRGTAGVCDSALPAFTGWGWDNGCILTVTLDDGSGATLSSATKTAIEANRSLNLTAVGPQGEEEIIQFSTATLTTGTTYQLTGILRNLFGSERHNASHAIGDSFVLLRGDGMANVPGSIADLGQTRYYKAVPRGRSSANVTAESITCQEVRLLPYAPVDVRNDAGTVKWNRRSRIEGVIGADPPLGEVNERYDAELYDGVTLEDSDTGLTVKVYQLSDLIGRGIEAEKAIP